MASNITNYFNCVTVCTFEVQFILRPNCFYKRILFGLDVICLVKTNAVFLLLFGLH